MTLQERTEKIKKLLGEVQDLLYNKGLAYSSEDDAMKNLNEFGPLGIIIRMSDKFSRLRNLTNPKNINKGNTVLSESVEDTIKDIIGYAALLMVMMKEEEK